MRVTELDLERGLAVLTFDARTEALPELLALTPGTPFPAGALKTGIRRVAEGDLQPRARRLDLRVTVLHCQIGVSLTIATKHEHVPIDFALYMPASWTDDPARWKKARVPVDLVFKTKIDLALDLITRAVEDKIHGRDRARGCRVRRLERVPHYRADVRGALPAIGRTLAEATIAIAPRALSSPLDRAPTYSQ